MVTQPFFFEQGTYYDISNLQNYEPYLYIK